MTDFSAALHFSGSFFEYGTRLKQGRFSHKLKASAKIFKRT